MKQPSWKEEIRRFSHHAYAIAGEAQSIHAALFELLEKELEITLAGYPDLHYVTSGAFSIAEARSLKERVSRRGTTDGKKIFIIECFSINGEAQNALLKVLEEPSGDSLIFIIVPSLSLFLPTVTSRLMVFVDESAQTPAIADEAKKFIRQTAPERMVTVKKMVDDIADEKRPRADAVEFIRSLEVTLSKDASAVKKDPGFFELLLRSEQDATLSGASLKMLLEHIALRLPA